MPELLVLAIGAAVAGFVQGISGFAFSMVALSIWAWTIEPRLAAAMAVCGGLSGQLFNAATVRRGLHLPLLWPFLAGGALGVPLGVLLLPMLDPARFKLVLGIALLACCSGMLFARRLPSVERFGRAGDTIAGAVGGAMGGLGGITGAAPALWCTLRGLERDAQRAVVQHFRDPPPLAARLRSRQRASDRAPAPRAAALPMALAAPAASLRRALETPIPGSSPRCPARCSTARPAIPTSSASCARRSVPASAG